MLKCNKLNKNTKKIEIKDESQKTENYINELKRENLMINSYKKEIKELKEQVNDMKTILMMKKKINIKE